MQPLLRSVAALLAVSPTLALGSFAQGAFVNWETPHVHPIDLTPNGARLVAVNTADGRLEVFDATGAELVALPAIPVGVDPVSVRARTNTEVWVVNHLSDSVSIVDLPSGRVRATLATEDEPADVVFAGNPQRAFVSCSQDNSVLVFDPSDLGLAPTIIELDVEDPRAMAVSPTGDEVYVAVFESGNGSTAIGGGLADDTLSFPPNIVQNPIGPHGGANPPPNDGPNFVPAQNGANPAPPEVGLIVKKDGANQWMDDNGGNWTSLVSGAFASLSGRLVGWDLPDRDVAVIDASTLSVSWVTRLMNLNMAMAVHPTTGNLTVVGTDGINEVRFEPNLNGIFLRVLFAGVDLSGPSASVVDMNDHLDYSTATVAQTERDKSLGDPRGIAWNAAGSRGYVTGMGSNNLIVVDGNGARVGLAPTIEVAEGPTGIVLDESSGRAFVLAKFEAAISVVDLTSELEVDRVAFHDASPTAIKVGRKHLYDTHANSGLGQIACASCHVDARMDRLAWDLGDPGGEMKGLTGQNLSAGLPLGIVTPFEDFHPMKGPMLTQTMQDIIGKEPHHWRGDRDGLEEFSGAFIGLQGDDSTLGPLQMQEFEDFLATIHFPPNPYRNLDNSLPDSLELEGHYSPGLFSIEGGPLPTADATRGLELYRPPNLLDQAAVACATCHTLPTGLGTDTVLNIFGGGYQPIAPGPNGERHHALVSVDGSTNVTLKVPQLRNLYERTGFDLTHPSNRAGFGYIHDGSVDSIERFVSEPIFNVTSDQDIADLTAFMLAFSGSDLPVGSSGNILEPPSTLSLDSHAAVGAQTTLVELGSAPPEQLALIAQVESMADANKIGLVANVLDGDESRGWTYQGADAWQSDRAAESTNSAGLQGLAALGSEVTYTVVPKGTETRVGIDRDGDGAFDRDEVDAASDPADPASTPGGCVDPVPAAPTGLSASAAGAFRIALDWTDSGFDETAYRLERRVLPGGTFSTVTDLDADTVHFTDIGLDCEESYEYRLVARSCAGDSAAATVVAASGACPTLFADVSAVSLSEGGSQAWTIEVGAGFANQIYVIAGSASGTAPGIALGPVLLPLNPDSYFTFTLTNANSIPLTDTLGTLDGAGTATASFDLPAGLVSSSTAGLVLNHAAVIVDTGTSNAIAATNAVAVTLAP